MLLSRAGGRLHALAGACNHAGRLLSEGRREGTAIVCPGHGIAFDVRDGRRLTNGVDCGDQPVLLVEERAGGREVVLRLVPGAGVDAAAS